jgi:hypothetical protein
MTAPVDVVVRTCSTCPYYSKVESACRRHAPHIWPLNMNAKGEVQSFSGWPTVRDSNWCGEHPLNRAMATVGME